MGRKEKKAVRCIWSFWWFQNSSAHSPILSSCPAPPGLDGCRQGAGYCALKTPTLETRSHRCCCFLLSHSLPRDDDTELLMERPMWQGTEACCPQARTGPSGRGRQGWNQTPARIPSAAPAGRLGQNHRPARPSGIPEPDKRLSFKITKLRVICQIARDH